MKFILTSLFLFLAHGIMAQITIKGTVVDSATGKTMANVRIQNLNTREGVSSNGNGSFEWKDKVGEYLVFSYIGYRNLVIQVKPEMDQTEQRFVMRYKPIQLKEVRVGPGPTEYQKDSMYRANMYEDAFTYQQKKSVMSPVSTLYDAFSKKQKAFRHFHEQIIDLEKQKFIDTKYSKELVMTLTKSNEDDAMDFMKAYPMEFEYARTASELEIKMWIKFYYQEYQKGKTSKPLPTQGH